MSLGLQGQTPFDNTAYTEYEADRGELARQKISKGKETTLARGIPIYRPEDHQLVAQSNSTHLLSNAQPIANKEQWKRGGGIAMA